MIFWDEYFGWDWHGIRSAISGLAVSCMAISFIAATEGHRWFAPYSWIYHQIIEHAAASIIVTMLLLVMGYWYWRFQSGDY